ncbi:MAG: response regulator [Chloroflexi bacterium]|nr:response regulator [Chloroflexota bacterium]
MNQQRILIVENNIDKLSPLRNFLESKEFAVISAGNGKKGFEIARGEQPDLIVLDVDMPELDGWDLLRDLRADLKTEVIPVVVLTAHIMPNDRQIVIAAGGNGYVFKPFKIAMLLNEIERCLGEMA